MLFIVGPSVLIDRSDAPLETGATMWVETNGPVLLLGEATAEDVQKIVEATPEIQKAIIES